VYSMRSLGLIGRSRAIGEVIHALQMVANTEVVVLLHGERGTGKGLAAHAIHRLSGRSSKSFSFVNCAALPAGLIESELFGHVRGAFTGAISTRPGLLDAAEEGTLFLDEIGILPPDLQSRFLRLIEEREYCPVGGRETRRLNAQIVAATNQHLPHAVQEGRFLPDLLDRLNVFPVKIPALRDRREDIAPLLRHFFGREARYDLWKILQRRYLTFLEEQEWPGNVRQLRNLVIRITLTGKAALDTKESVRDLYLVGEYKNWD
jgi:transcriptional regulator with GAF, ATPase, and Fis domain